MKNFDDFIASISQSDQDWILNGDSDSSETVTKSDLPEYLIKRSFRVSLRLLAMYHQWLDQHE